MATGVGKVFLVGAGPGDPRLVTLRGQQCLALADVVLYDYLASPQLLDHAPATAERICLGRHGQGKIWTQDEINRRIVAEATAGRCVVRLKGGDPGIFGRLAEETSALAAAGIAFEVVPGVSAAMAAGPYAGVVLTNRDDASCVAFVTGHERPGKGRQGNLDYAALARFPGTLVFYMGVVSAPVWSRELLAGGLPPETPVCVVRRCSLPDQQVWMTTLCEVGQRLGAGGVRPPIIAIVGAVANRPEIAAWFDQRPLFGRRVLVTRPATGRDVLASELEVLGAQVLAQPAISIGPPADWVAVDSAIREQMSFDWTVFSSVNGVEFFLGRLFALGHDARHLGAGRIAAIGSATADSLSRFGLSADLVPEEFRAEALADALKHEVSGRRVLLVRASRGREVLTERLTAAGANVRQVVAYTSSDVTEPSPEVAAALAGGEIDWVTVTSSAIARSLVGLFGSRLHRAKLAAISPLTAGVLTELGYTPSAVAWNFTTTGLVEAIRAAEASRTFSQ